MKITLTAATMQKPAGLSPKASMAWDYYFNLGGWFVTELSDGSVLVTDESLYLTGNCTCWSEPSVDDLVLWLEEEANDKLSEDPTAFLTAAGLPEALLTSPVLEALTTALSSENKKQSDPAPAAAAPAPAPEPQKVVPRKRPFYVTFAVEGRYTVDVDAGSLEEAKADAQTAFEAEWFGDLDFVDSDLIAVEDETGNFVYEK